jgi:hypothetical protein
MFAPSNGAIQTSSCTICYSPVDIEVVRWFADLESSMGLRALMVACNSFILDAEVNMG